MNTCFSRCHFLEECNNFGTIFSKTQTIYYLVCFL